MKFEVGKYYKTYGGWKAKVIYKCRYNNDFYAIHEEEEIPEIYSILSEKKYFCDYPVEHNEDGKAISVFSVNAPPLFESHHPADLKEEN